LFAFSGAKLLVDAARRWVFLMERPNFKNNLVYGREEGFRVSNSAEIYGGGVISPIAPGLRLADRFW